MLHNQAGGEIQAQSSVTYSLGRFELSAKARLLTLDDEPVPIGNRALKLLLALVERAGEIIPSQELKKIVWPGQAIHEGNLRVQMGALRRVLAEGFDDVTPIKNIPMQGYGFVAPVLRVEREGGAIAELFSQFGLEHSRGNLPVGLTKLIGRDGDIQQISAALKESRLITIVGAGGIGKTATALAAARQIQKFLPDGVFFVELSRLNDVKEAIAILMSALDAAKAYGISLDSLVDHLRPRKILLLMDTCEHMVEEISALLETLLLNCPELRVIATSREPLSVIGEWLHRLRPLPVPGECQRLPIEEALTFAAIDLFVRRIQAAAHPFSSNIENISLIIKICRRLDGNPLALELAAARVGEIGLQAVADGLDDCFNTLARGRRTAAPRHQTLTATMDWSYGLLRREEKLVLEKISVFSGMFSAEAAAYIAEIDKDLVKHQLSRLFDKSLLAVDFSGDVVLYRVLDTVRSYALTKLDTATDSETARNRHASVVFHEVCKAEQDLERWELTIWRKRYAYLIEDIRLALDWGMSPGGDRLLAVELAARSIPLWFSLSLLDEFAKRLALALQINDDPAVEAEIEIRMWEALGYSNWHAQANMPAMKQAFRNALSVAQSKWLQDAELRALSGLIIHANMQGDHKESAKVMDQLGSVARKMADPEAGETCRLMAALSLHYTGHLAASCEHAKQVLHRPGRHLQAQGLGLLFDAQVMAMTILARGLWLRGFADQAWQCCLDGVQRAQAIGQGHTICFVLAIAVIPIAFWRGDKGAALQKTTRLMEVADKYSFGTWQVYGGCYQAVLRMQNEVQNERRFNYRIPPEIGHGLLETIATFDERIAGDGFLAVEGKFGGWSHPELLRIAAMRRLESAPHQERQIELLLNEAILLARQQGSLAWELRAATSLAELRYSMGRPVSARELLQGSLNKFTEGLKTADLERARDLLRRKHN